MELLEIAADRDQFGDHVAVVEFERGDALERIDLGVERRFVFEFGQIEFDHRNFQTLFGQKDAHPARIRRIFGVVKFHATRLPGPP